MSQPHDEAEQQAQILTTLITAYLTPHFGLANWRQAAWTAHNIVNTGLGMKWNEERGRLGWLDPSEHEWWKKQPDDPQKGPRT